jgi:hypothetical protein
MRDESRVTHLTCYTSRVFHRLWVNSCESYRLLGSYFRPPEPFGLRLGVVVAVRRSFNKAYPYVESKLKLCWASIHS